MNACGHSVIAEETAAEHVPVAADAAAMWDSIDTQIEATGFSGAAAVVQNGKPVFAAAYGFENRSTETPNTLETRFALASTAKLFTAIALMQLVEEGRVALSDPVGKFLPDYPNATIRDRATVLHLLKMQSGLGDFFGPLYEENKARLKSHSDYVRLFEHQPPGFEPGSGGEYSNAGYILLGRIIEEASGEDFYRYVKRKVFDPLGMSSTDYGVTYELTPGVAVGYRAEGFEGIPESEAEIEGRPLVSNSEFVMVSGTAAGGGYSTVGDFARLDHALRSDRLISPDSLAVIFGEEFVAGEHGAGIAGGAPGVSTRYRLRSDGLSIVVFGNKDLPGAPTISKLIDSELK